MTRFHDLPRYVRIDLTSVYELFDRLAMDESLPVIDIEAIMSCLVDVLYKPTINRSTEDSIRFAINEIVGLSRDNRCNYYRLYGEFTIALRELLKEFEFFQMYSENRLLYDYTKRFTRTTALLKRKDNLCL